MAPDLLWTSEALFGAPPDMEWTFSGGQLSVLQSRPITTLRQAAKGDQRPWYLSLSRSISYRFQTNYKPWER